MPAAFHPATTSHRLHSHFVSFDPRYYMRWSATPLPAAQSSTSSENVAIVACPVRTLAKFAFRSEQRSMFMGLQIAQSRYYLQTLDPKAGTLCNTGSPRVWSVSEVRSVPGVLQDLLLQGPRKVDRQVFSMQKHRRKMQAFSENPSPGF